MAIVQTAVYSAVSAASGRGAAVRVSLDAAIAAANRVALSKLVSG